MSKLDTYLQQYFDENVGNDILTPDEAEKHIEYFKKVFNHRMGTLGKISSSRITPEQYTARANKAWQTKREKLDTTKKK
jgi:glutaredoxin 2